MFSHDKLASCPATTTTTAAEQVQHAAGIMPADPTADGKHRLQPCFR
jgi:hypothetical protein